MGALPGGAVEYAAFMDAEPADAAETKELADWLFGRRQFPKLDGVDTELLGCEVGIGETKLFTAIEKFAPNLQDSFEYA